MQGLPDRAAESSYGHAEEDACTSSAGPRLVLSGTRSRHRRPRHRSPLRTFELLFCRRCPAFVVLSIPSIHGPS
eukprot:347516-Chlamydomonas_euryale.AAC.1